MMLLYIYSVIVLVIILIIFGIKMYNKRLDAIYKEYDEIKRKYGDKAPDHCPHRIIVLGRPLIPFVIGPSKWCKLCGKLFGPDT